MRKQNALSWTVGFPCDSVTGHQEMKIPVSASETAASQNDAFRLGRLALLLGMPLCFGFLVVVVLFLWQDRLGEGELAKAKSEVLLRFGTDDARAILPPPIADEDNFFALPVIASWRTDSGDYVIPADAFWPADLPKPKLVEGRDGRASTIDWTEWTARGVDAGGSSAHELHARLAGGRSLLAELAKGLDRPASCLLPMRSGEFAEPKVSIPSVMSRQTDLALRLRVAASAGDAEQTRLIAQILLRLFAESSASHGTLLAMLIGDAVHDEAFAAIQDALSFPVWSQTSLSELQVQLARVDDLQALKRASLYEMLLGHKALMDFRSEVASRDLGKTLWRVAKSTDYSVNLVALGPLGWRDADAAFQLRFWLTVIGPEKEDGWIQAQEATSDLIARFRREKYLVDGVIVKPHLFLSNLVLPNLGKIHSESAFRLFERRSLIAACELEKYRLVHGVYPAALPVVPGFSLNDPARPGKVLGYRREGDGYLLWSAGPDSRDNGGDKSSDWVWRMQRSR